LRLVVDQVAAFLFFSRILLLAKTELTSAEFGQIRGMHDEAVCIK
jgi:hypothetical protein